MLTDRHYFLLAVVIYGFSAIYSVFLWRKGFRTHDRVNYGLLLAGFCPAFKGHAHARADLQSLPCQ